MALEPGQVSFDLGGIPFGNVDAFGVDWSIEKFDGWTGATKSTSQLTQKPRQSGAWRSTGYSSSRSVAASGKIFAPTPAALSDAFDRLNAAIPAGVDVVLTVHDAVGDRWTTVQQSDDILTDWILPDTGTWSIQVEAADWRKFGSSFQKATKLPSTSGGLVIAPTTYAWTGTANASTSTMSVGGSVQRTNRVPNPGFNTDTSGWSSSATWDSANRRLTGSLSTAMGEGGAAVQTTVPAAAGDRRRFGARFYNTSSSALTVSLQVVPRNGSTNLAYLEGTAVTVQPGTDAWLTNTPSAAYQASTNGALLNIRVGAGGWPAGSSYALDNVIDTEYGDGSTVQPADYFDGSFPAAGGLTITPTAAYYWSGDRYQSPSVAVLNGVPQRTNLALNPTFADGLVPSGSVFQNIGSGEFTRSIVLGAAPSGGNALRATAVDYNGDGSSAVGAGMFTPTVQPGTYFASFWVRQNGAAVNAVTYREGSAATQNVPQTPFTLPTNTWVRVSYQIVVTGAGTLKPGVILNVAPGVLVDYADFLIEQTTSTTPGTVFDGNTPTVGGLTIGATIVTGQVSFTNPGNESGPVVLRIDGPCVGPVVTHLSTGAALVFSSSLVLQAGEYLLIDMDARTALANGQANRAGYITSRGWSAFDPGDNTWAFTAAQYDAASQLTVTAVPAWR